MEVQAFHVEVSPSFKKIQTKALKKQSCTWTKYFTSDKRSQVQDRFEFLVGKLDMTDAEAHARFEEAYQGLGKKRPKSSGAPLEKSASKKHKPCRKEPPPTVIFGEATSEKHYKRLQKTAAAIKPRRMPFMLRNIQIEEETTL